MCCSSDGTVKKPAIVRRKPVLELKTRSELEKMRAAGRVVAEVLKILEKSVRPGISTKELDVIAEKEIRARGAEPAFLNYCGFPASLCASVNDEVVHGIPSSKRVLRNGDIISFDLGAVIGGYYGDSAITVPVGTITKEQARLLDVTRISLEKGLEQVKPGAYLGDISSAVQMYVESNGMSVIRDFVGHGIGRHLHEEPAVPNYGKKGTGVKLEPGVVIAVEPMVAAEDWHVRVLGNGWTVVTEDGSMAAHFEHTVAVTENGSEILTLI